MRFFKFCEKPLHGNCMIICIKLQQDKALNMIQMIFCLKYFVLGFPEKKESKLGFLSFGTNQFIEFFWFFCMALQQLANFFDRILVLGFWEQKYLKIGLDWKFLKFYGESNILHKFRLAWKLEIASHGITCSVVDFLL